MESEEGPLSGSSSDSDSDVESDSVVQSSCSTSELTLQDDDVSPLIVQQPLDDEGEDEGEDGQIIAFEEEGEGEGAEEKEPVQDASVQKEPDKKKKKRRRKKLLYICMSNCKYEVVRRTARKFGFKEVSEDDDWTLYWTDYSVALERVMDMKKYQKINHFPGMNEICRKDLLARNLNRMLKLFPKEYYIFPKTWCLPADYGDFQAYTRQKKNKTYILKPESGCQGRGIWITRSPKDIKPHEHMICQVYTGKPFLIDGFKFDLRVYTLVTSCDPLRIFVFKDGLARFATSKYCEPSHNNTDNVYMHLTNYAINKNSEDFVRDDEAGSKRRITTINRYLQGKGFDVDKMWGDIDDVIIKTLISAHSVLKHNYRSCFPNHVRGSACFEILGFDVLLDRRLRPYVIEVNHSPSFTTDAAIDREIKGALIWDTLNLVNFGAIDRKRCLEEERKRIKDRLMGKSTKKETKEELEVAQQQYLEHLETYEAKHLGNFRRIFPANGSDKYDKYFHSSGTLFQETASFKARSELARQQREEISRKKEKLEMMTKGKKQAEGLRPESPIGQRRRPVHKPLQMRPRVTYPPSWSEDTRSASEKIADTRLPVDILEEEELERISGLLQRDNLVRGLGIVEHVYRLLHCTPGTTSIAHAEPKPQSLSLGGLRVQAVMTGTQSHLPLYTSGQGSVSPIVVKAKDKSYYKNLLDRYFGPNHALAKHADKLGAKAGSSGEPSHGPCELWTSEKSKATALGVGSNTSSRSLKPMQTSSQAFPQVRLTHSKQTYGGAQPALMRTLSYQITDLDCDVTSSESSMELGPSRQLGQVKTKSLNNNHKPLLQDCQRSKLGRKGAPGAGARMGMVVQESDIRLMSGVLDTDAERSRLLGRSGNPPCNLASYSHTSAGSYMSDWGRSDSSTPARVRVLSGTRHQRESEVAARFVMHPSSLSVVSAAAPVFQRPDISPARLNLQPPHGAGAVDTVNTHRSTKSQRIRGATNSVRLRELEMRENQAFILS